MLIALVLLAVVAAIAAGYWWGRRSAPPITTTPAHVAASPPAVTPVAADSTPATPVTADATPGIPAAAIEVDNAATSDRAVIAHLETLAEERRRLFVALAEARAETARYRDIVIDIENNAPPPLLGGRGTPDDLKLIVGIGPVLERMLHQLGITTYRQIARWTERDIDEFDARLPEFPGRIRRDAWVTQARALHQGLHGEPL